MIRKGRDAFKGWGKAKRPTSHSKGKNGQDQAVP